MLRLRGMGLLVVACLVAKPLMAPEAALHLRMIGDLRLAADERARRLRMGRAKESGGRSLT